MRVLLLITALVFVSSCNVVKDRVRVNKEYRIARNNLQTAQQYLGLHERRDRAALREQLGVDPVHTEWCAAFVNSVLEEAGLPTSGDVENNPWGILAARSYLEWGESVETPIPGDIMVFTRKGPPGSGHVGFYVDTIEWKGVNYWVVLGGNQDQSVSYMLFRTDTRRHLDTRRWRLTDDNAKMTLSTMNWQQPSVPLIFDEESDYYPTNR